MPITSITDTLGRTEEQWGQSHTIGGGSWKQKHEEVDTNLRVPASGGQNPGNGASFYLILQGQMRCKEPRVLNY